MQSSHERDSQVILGLTPEQCGVLREELELKMEGAPVDGELRREYREIYDKLGAPRNNSDREVLSKLQIEMLRNLASSGHIQYSLLADRITEADNRTAENGTVTLELG